MIPVIDMHCDTILGLLERKDKNLSVSLCENDLSVDLKKMKAGGYLLQNFALFTDLKSGEIPEQRALRLYSLYKDLLEENKEEIAPVYTYDDIERNRSQNKLSALLTLEEGDVVNQSLQGLQDWYEKGVRMIALTWNYKNSIGHPNVESDTVFADYKTPALPANGNTKDGLSEFGIAYVKEMERLGIIIDISHSSDKVVKDVLKYTTKPFVASHSNSRSLTPVSRNLTDEQIKKIAQRKGVIGINFCADFLNQRKENTSRIEDMIAHIQHLKSVGGIDCIGLGTDFDGIHSQVDIADASYMQKLADALFKEGFSQEEVEKIFYKNVLRLYKDVLK